MFPRDVSVLFLVRLRKSQLTSVAVGGFWKGEKCNGYGIYFRLAVERERFRSFFAYAAYEAQHGCVIFYPSWGGVRGFLLLALVIRSSTTYLFRDGAPSWSWSGGSAA